MALNFFLWLPKTILIYLRGHVTKLSPPPAQKKKNSPLGEQYFNE